MRIRTSCRCTPQAIGGSAKGDEKKTAEFEFVEDTPDWLKESAAMAADFMDTPACERLRHNKTGAHAEVLGFPSVRNWPPAATRFREDLGS